MEWHLKIFPVIFANFHCYESKAKYEAALQTESLSRTAMFFLQQAGAYVPCPAYSI